MMRRAFGCEHWPPASGNPLTDRSCSGIWLTMVHHLIGHASGMTGCPVSVAGSVPDSRGARRFLFRGAHDGFGGEVGGAEGLVGDAQLGVAMTVTF